MQRLLTVVTISNGKVHRASLEVLSHCVTLSERHNAEAAVLVVGDSPAAHVDQLAGAGAQRIFLVDAPGGSAHRGDQTLSALEAVATQYDPNLVAFANSEAVKQILGSAAVRLNAAAISDVTSFDFVDHAIEATRPAHAGKTVSTVRATAARCVVSVRPGSFEFVPRPSNPLVESICLQSPGDARGVEVQELPQMQTARVELSEASIVVAAGRGVQDAASKALVEELADLLGAAVGATRAVVETGLFPASAQIGQTGKVVAPDLYIGLGVSGALQHTAGIMDSRVIVAINKNPQAPLFEIATYALVDDLRQVVPLLIERLRAVRHSQT